MKRMKKLLSLTLAMMMVLVMGLPVLAAGEGTITIDNAIAGKEYKIYKIFELESYNAGDKAFAYKVTDENWAEFVKNEGAAYVTADEQGYISWVGDNTAERAKAFADAAIKFAVANGIAPVATETAASETVTFTGLDLGYYLVSSDAGALVSLDTTQPNVTMKEKNGEPTIDKDVQNGTDADGNPVWDKDNTASIGDVVNYQATISVKANATGYVVNDTMSKGLTFNEGSVTVVRIPVGDTAETTVAPENYTATSTAVENGTNLKVAFKEEFLAGLQPGDTLIVRYNATVNADAETEGTGNSNAVKLEYGNDQETEESTTKTYVYEFDVDKFTIREGADEHTQLAGAKFTLSVKDAEGNLVPITFSKVDNTTVYKADKESDVIEITTDESGKFTLSGLAAGTYYLTETEAPAGYNKLAAPIEVQIIETIDDQGNRTGVCTIKNSMLDQDGNSTITDTTGDAEDNTVAVENKTGVELPSTGGIGTTIFYVLGGILVVGAGIMLVVKKRMGSEKQ